MRHLKKLPRRKCGDAVSPVVGVMLMLVVTIIIAAVVSGFSGGMLGTNSQKAPTLNMDVKIINSGSWAGSGFFATVTGVSEPIPTKNLKIVTSWTTYQYKGTVGLRNLKISCTTTVLPDIENVQYIGNPDVALSDGLYVAPFGNGPGVNGTEGTIGGVDTQLTTFSGIGQQFGNYTLVQGTTLSAIPCGASSSDYIGGSGGTSATNGYGVKQMFYYSDDSSSGSKTKADKFSKYIDPTTAVLGSKWNFLYPGDKVAVKVIYVPTGAVIFQRDVTVTEG